MVKHEPITSEIEKIDLKQFFNKLENAVDNFEYAKRKAVHDSIHLLREELGVM